MTANILDALHVFSVALNFLVAHVPAHRFAEIEVNTVCTGEISANEVHGSHH